MRAFWAKVLGRMAAPSSTFCGGLAASEEVDANGFEDVPLAEKRLAEVPLLESDANGFACGFAPGFTPNSVSPKLVAGCAVSFGWLLSTTFFSAWCTAVCLVARKALTLPSLRRHAFLLQAHRYTLLSCPGNLSGKSPLICNSRFMSPLHTLHLAKLPDGAVSSSSHVYIHLSAFYYSFKCCACRSAYRMSSKLAEIVVCGLFRCVA